MQEDHWRSGKASAEQPSAWMVRFVGLVPAGGAVLDLACGPGRHAFMFAARGHPVTAIGRDLAALASGGALLWETFAAGNEKFGRPRNPDFLLRPGELLEMVRGTLDVVAFEDGRVDTPRPAMGQRIASMRQPFDRAAARLDDYSAAASRREGGA